ncbi:sulfatase-like hydrolase/transferase [Bremerella sp. JC817]|uniref:sulfatase-like hydrolase/transferase n=1 Tax=Bremerella sp. JC817 TaxID=3231756 RepID=UPI003458151A
MKSFSRIWCLMVPLVFIAWHSASADETLQPVKYRNPGLKVDLGVGLWAWPMPIDWDSDGDTDLLVSCPDVPFNGTYLFENPGGDTKFPIFKPPVKVGGGLHSIHVSYVDGKPRILSPGTEWVNFLGDKLADSKTIHSQKNIHPNRVRANQWRYVDYDDDGLTDLMVGVGDWTEYGWDDAFDSQGNWTRGPLRGYVYWLRNTGTNEDPTYDTPEKLMTGNQPIELFGMPSPNLADFDNDGDLDLLCGEFLDGFTYFENQGNRKQPKFAAGRRLTYEGEPIAMDLQMITPTSFDWDGDGDIDLIVGDEDGRVALVEHTGKFVDGVPQFLPPRYFQQEANALKFGALATPVSVDWDGDGDEDLVVGNSAGNIGWFENLDGGNPPKWDAIKLLKVNGKPIRPQAGPNGSIQGPAEAKWGYTTLSVADWDHDGRKDLIVNSIWGKVEWYRNTGSLDELAAAQPVEVEWPGNPPKPAWNWWDPKARELVTQWRTTPVVIDLNQDGLNDLVSLDHEGYLSFFERKKQGDQLVLLPGKRIFTDRKHKPLQLNSKTAGGSGRRKLCFADWNGDGKLDLLANSRNVDLFLNVSTDEHPWAFDSPVQVHSHRLAGHTTSPTIVNWNNDDRPDLLVGAEDGHFYTIENNWKPFDSRQVGSLTIERRSIQLGTLAEGQLAYGNRPYTWISVPAPFDGWQFVQGNGGETDYVFATADKPTTIYMATSASVKPSELSGWKPVEDGKFQYGDAGKTSMQVYQRDAEKGERVAIPQMTWTGGMLLLPPAKGASPAPQPKNNDMSEHRPNVLFIAVDDLRVQLGCYGDPIVQTPNIDRLASRGVLFEHAYCQQALCNPSRASIMTGQYPDSLGIWDLPTHFREVQPDVVTLPQHFKNQGYYTRNIGKVFHNYSQKIQNDPQAWSVPPMFDWGAHSQDWYVAGKPFELHKGPKGPAIQKVDVADEAYLDGRIAEEAAKAIRQQVPSDQPFFLAVGFWKPHLPFNAPQKYWDLYDSKAIADHASPASHGTAPEIARHDSREVRSYTDVAKSGPIAAEKSRQLQHGYYAAISFLDAQIGKVLDALEQSGQADDTIVVLWSDHGFHLGEHDLWCKTSNFELDAHVPLVIADPRNKYRGERTEALVELVDLYPTLVDLCELPTVKRLDGTSLRPVLTDPKAKIRETALTQHPRPAYFKGKPEVMGYSIRTPQYRYTEWRDFASGQVLATELYDHHEDPAENSNLAGDKRTAQIQSHLAKLLQGRIGTTTP